MHTRSGASVLARALATLALVGCASDGSPSLAAGRPDAAAPIEAAPRAAPVEPVRPGLDTLLAEEVAPLRGRRGVGLVVNHSALTRDGRHALDVLRAAPGVNLVAILTPEHGLAGLLDQAVPSGRDAASGLPIYSLYGESRRPTPDMLAGLDTLVFDIQDVGARFYTYISTLGACLEEAALNRLRVVVLDRPHPLGGTLVDGPLPDPDLVGSFTCYEALPIVHGMTIGELARLFVRRKRLDVELVVVPVTGWRRGTWFDATGLPWVDPSPNLRSLAEVLLYPAVALLEAEHALSVGRGTDRPFEYVGAPWVDGPALAAALRARRIPGLWVAPATFVPSSVDVSGRANPAYPHVGKPCRGVRLTVTDRAAFNPVLAGLHLVQAIHALHPDRVRLERLRGLVGSREVLEGLAAGEAPQALAAAWREAPGYRAFLLEREASLLYD